MTQTEIRSLTQQLGNHLDDLKTLMSTTSEEILCRKPDISSWSPKEILGHIYDVELVFQYRLKMIAERNLIAIPSFNQNLWVQEHEYNQWDTQLLVDTFISLRRNLIFWLGRIKEAIWVKEGIHSERGKVTFQSLVDLLLSHYKHHFNQIQDRINA